MNKDKALQIRKDIVQHALPHVIFDGWNMDVIAQAAKECGHDASIIKSLYPEGIIDVLKTFSALADDHMMLALQDINPDNLRIRDRIKQATIKRLEWLNQYKDAVRESVPILAFPTRKKAALSMVWKTADKIWLWAGDTSKDYNFYTKRTLLSGVLTSTTLAWLNDDSDSMAQSRVFLDNRINNVTTIGQFISKFKRR